MSAPVKKRWTLKFVLPGLIAHVHDPKNGQWLGVLVNSAVEGHAVHDPQLRFANNDFASDQKGVKRPDESDVVGDPSIPNGALIWKLSHMDVELKPVNGAKLSPKLTPYESKTRPKTLAFEKLQDIRLAADMREIHPEASEIDPKCFDPVPPADMVVARFRLGYGTIGTYKFTEFKREPVTNWTFGAVSAPVKGAIVTTPVLGPVTQPVPVALVCEITVEDGPVLCEGTKFGTNDPRGFVLDAPDGGEVTIQSSNCPKFFDPLDIVGGLQLDTDFLLYYQVSTLKNPKQRFVPTRPDTQTTPKGGNCCACIVFAPLSS